VSSVKTWAGWVGSGLVLLFVAGLVGWTWGRSNLKADIAAAPKDTVVHFVTVPYAVPEIRYIHLPARIDTLRDTTFMMNSQIVASIDTVMSGHQDTLRIEYAFPPANVFNVDFRPGPIPVLTKVETVTKTVFQSEISIPWIIGCLTTGIVAGVIIEKKLK
jgi:hypothetical protein